MASSSGHKSLKHKNIESFFRPIIPVSKKLKPDDANKKEEDESVANDQRIIVKNEKELIEDHINTTYQNDIGLVLGERIDDCTKQRLLESPWMPDDKYNFPYSEHNKGGKTEKRYLKRSHLISYPWAVYSPSQKGLFCKYCTLFTPGFVGGYQKNVPLQKLVTKPLQSFARLLGKDGDLERHSSTSYHHRAMELGNNFLKTSKDPNKEVINQLNEQRLAAITENRARLKPIIQTIMFLGRQNIAFRGDRDDGKIDTVTENSPINCGNFKELLRFRIEAGDNVLENHLATSSSRATYISKTTQNELIECLGEEILTTILDRVNKSKFYSIIFDETTDVSHTSQLSLILRYIHDKTVREDFIQFVDGYKEVEKMDNASEPCLTGENLGQLVINALKRLNVDLSNCVGIGTDGCNVMISEIRGAVQTIKSKAKNASRCPCYNHALNLSLSKSSSVQSVRNAVGTIKETTSFFTASAKRNLILTDTVGKQLPRMCETRWVERHATVLQFQADLPSILEALLIISEWRELETAAKAKSLMAALTTSEFIVAIVCLTDILTLTLPLSRYLQKETVSLDAACRFVQDTIKQLDIKRTRCEQEFDQLFTQCQDIAAELDVEIKVPRLVARQKNRENHPGSTPSIYFRTSIYIPLIESVVEDLKNRFPEETLKVYGLTLLVPKVFKENEDEGQTMSQLMELAEKYSPLLGTGPFVTQKLVSSEFKYWKMKWDSSPEFPTNAISSLDYCDADRYPTINALLRVLVTLPASVASAERSFSTLRRIKTWIRSRMGEERLTGLALMNIHRDIIPNIDKVIDRYANKSKRRLDFVL